MGQGPVSDALFRVSWIRSQNSCGDLGGSRVTRGLNSESLAPLGSFSAILACTQAETAVSRQLGIDTY